MIQNGRRIKRVGSDIVCTNWVLTRRESPCPRFSTYASGGFCIWGLIWAKLGIVPGQLKDLYLSCQSKNVIMPADPFGRILFVNSSFCIFSVGMQAFCKRCGSSRIALKRYYNPASPFDLRMFFFTTVASRGEIMGDVLVEAKRDILLRVCRRSTVGRKCGRVL